MGTTTRHLKIGVVGLALLATACGGGDATETTSADAAGATTVPPTATGSAPDGFCEDVLGVRGRIFELQKLDRSGPLQLCRQLHRGAHDEMAALDVPEEIDEDWATMTEFMTEMTGILGGLDFSDPEAANQALSEQAAALEELAGEAEGASGRIDTYIESYCGVDLTGTTPPGS